MKPFALIIALASVTLGFAENACEHCAVSETSGKSCALTQSLPTYFSIQKALANDDFEGARIAARKSEMSCSDDDKECCASMAQNLADIAASESIESARKTFKSLSDALIAELEANTAESDDLVYKMFCPMAFANTGGAWLQDSDDLRNPYYGATMLKCGMPQAVFGKTE